MKQLSKLSSLVLIGVLGISGFAQPQAITHSPAPASSNQSPNRPLAFGLEDGTPVRLRLSRNISSADARTGETVDFEVLEDVTVGDIVLIPRGGIAWATVTEAQSKRRLGRGGKLNINIDSVRLASGEKAALRAIRETEGGGHTGKMTGAVVATTIVFFPAAPLFLFMKGKDITIPKGTEITAYINGDISLDPRNFGDSTRGNGQDVHPSSLANSEPAQKPTDSEFSSIVITSAPEGAEIVVDGKFVGSTPSTIRLRFGDHKISIQKAGYISWERVMTVGAGSNITVNAGLEKAP